MRCHITCKLTLWAFLAFLSAFLCAVQSVSFLYAQNTPIVLVENAQGQEVYINPGAPPVQPIQPISRSVKFFQSTPPQIKSLISQTAGRFQVDPKLVNAIIRVESGFDARAVSPKGAEGLMQLIPATAERFGVADPFDSRQNIRGGVSYLRYLLDHFNGNVPLSLAAYNAGENRVDRDGGIPAIPETVNYVRKVTALYQGSSAGQSIRMITPGQAGPSNHSGRFNKTVSTSSATQPAQDTPIYRYVDAWGVTHFTND